MSTVDPEWRHPGTCGTTAASLLILALAGLAPAPAHAATTLVRTLDEVGRPLTDGSVVFCPLDTDCREFPITNDGAIALDRDQLEPGTTYTIIVYDARRTVRYAAFAWTYDPAAFAPTPGGTPVVPRLQGNARQEVAFDFTPEHGPTPTAPPTATPEAAAAKSLPPSRERPLAMPRFVAGACVPFMLGGHFGVDREALGGVNDVAPGFGAFFAYRFGYPASRRPGPTTVGFREFSLSYAANRYTVAQIEAPTESSDLTFHRLTVALGVGRLTARTMVSGALAIGYGGVYDGSELLEYGGRTYGMIGVGIQGRCGYRLLGGDAHGLGLLGQLDLMYYPADTGEDDHWYGLAPSLAVGVVVH